MSTASQKFDLEGRTALITGASGLLGTQHAAALLESGATVVLTDIDTARLEAARATLATTAPKARILVHLMDVTSPDSIAGVQDALVGEGRAVDILVNNAAIDPKVTSGAGIIESSRLENFDKAQWDLQIAVGLTGAFLCAQTFGTAMARGDGGVILNIASDLSVFSPDQRLYRKDGLPEDLQPVKPVTYSVIKTGLVGLSRYLATYWPNVRCNALSPGGVFTGQGEEFVTRLSALIPAGRMARPDEYRAVIQFLCSDASTYMNGQNVVMDGGRSVW
ncbi:MAG: SDR family oxidoreductase [Rhizobiaceae bacterium]|nr:SDR family oxidoreductase [Rhizobiaceae bacterium]